MPLAPIVDHWRIMAVFQGVSNLPEDRIINTFHFRNDNIAGGPDAIADGLKQAIDEFYAGTPSGTNLRLAAHMSKAALASLEYRVYDLGQPEPRAPLVRAPSPDVFATMETAPGLPWEMCACISWGTNVIAPKPKAVGKRGRGRNYIGPLSFNILDTTESANNYLSAQARASFSDAGKRLLNNPGFSLVVLSTTYAQTDVVTKGFVDNALDVQRRRGPQATGRTLFTP